MREEATPFLVVKDLLVKRDNRIILNKVNISLEKGQTLVLMGLSGAGKSTLLKCINGLLKPYSGEILINGENIINLRGHSLDALRRRLGMVFQSAALFDSMNIMDNVSFGLRENKKMKEAEILKKVTWALDAVELQGTEKKFPSQLSGGMQKRASIARAVITDPELLLYDEPTSGLDPIMSGVINDLINSIKQKLNATSIVVTHDLNSAYAIADKIVLLFNGDFVQTGTPEDFKNTKNPIVKQFIEGSSTGPIKL